MMLRHVFTHVSHSLSKLNDMSKDIFPIFNESYILSMNIPRSHVAGVKATWVEAYCPKDRYAGFGLAAMDEHILLFSLFSVSRHSYNIYINIFVII